MAGHRVGVARRTLAILDTHDNSRRSPYSLSSSQIPLGYPRRAPGGFGLVGARPPCERAPSYGDCESPYCKDWSAGEAVAVPE
eukprot:264304-Pleurochrysis_carterae.AAC.1